LQKAEFIIREFKPTDLNDVVSINRKCLPENYAPSFFLEHHYENPKIFLVAEVDGKIAGYVMCRMEFGLSNFKKMFARKGHVISLAVLDEYRRRGIGYALMKEAMKNMAESGASEVYLEVRVSNHPAISLYKKLGFKPVKVINRYYADGEDAYLMAVELKETTPT